MKCSRESRSGVHEIGQPELDSMNVTRLKRDWTNMASDDVVGTPKWRTGVAGTDNSLRPGGAPEWLSYAGRSSFLPPDTILEPISRKPIVLPESTRLAVHNLPVGIAPALRGQILPPKFDLVARTSVPRVSIVVVTRDNLVFSKLCLESVLANTDYPNYELIVVDNGSGDELITYLDQLADRHPFVRVVRNLTNLGFAAANNLGLALATGNTFVLLNNDTIVPHCWLTRLVGHLDDPQAGAVGPVTNRIGNEAQIETSYRTYSEFERVARHCSHGHVGERFEIPMLAMFCFAIRRETYERVGALDEQYDIGMFEDDDYAVRLRANGYRLFCAEDVFVHHFGGASFGSLLSSLQFQELLKTNRERYERKWGIAWQPHRHRANPVYKRKIARIREVVRKVIPAGARVLVISKGDPDLLELEGRVAQHFPQNPDGTYTGYHPAESDDAINHLKSLHRGGAEFLVIPSPALWWLDHYVGFGQYLADVGQEAFRDADLCVIFHLPRPLYN
jgi:GT2 family glycosyltransferase